MKSIKTFVFRFPSFIKWLLVFTKVSNYTNGVISEWRKTSFPFPFERNPQWKPEIAFIHWLNKFIPLTSDGTHLSLMISSLHKRILKVYYCNFLKDNAPLTKTKWLSKKVLFEILIHDYICSKFSFEHEKTRSHCPPRNFYFFVPSDDELTRWYDKTVHKAKPTDIREQFQDINREIINWTRLWHMILAVYVSNMFSSKKVISDEKRGACDCQIESDLKARPFLDRF